MNNIESPNIVNYICGVVFFLFIGIYLVYFYYWRDNNLIRRDIEKIGGKFLTKELQNNSWTLWRRSPVRKYRVRYIDSIEKEHFAICKTACLPWVYWASDSVDGHEILCNGMLPKE